MGGKNIRRKKFKKISEVLHPSTRYLTELKFYNYPYSDNWYFRFSMKKGSQIRLSTNTPNKEEGKEVALSQFYRYETIGREGRSIVPDSVEKLVKTFIKNQQERYDRGLIKNKGTIDNKEYCLKGYLLPFLNKNQTKKRLIVDVEGKEFLEYFRWRNKGKKLSNNTLGSERSKIQEFFNWCALNNKISGTQKPIFERLKNYSGVSDGFSEEEYKRLTTYLNTKFIKKDMTDRERISREVFRDFVYVATNTGARLSELYEIRQKDIQHKNIIKGNRYSHSIFNITSDNSKTGVSRDNPCMRGDIVKRTQERTAKILGKEKLSSNDYLFVSVDGYKLTTKNTSVWWNKVREEIDLTHRKLQVCRHFAITTRLKMGVSPAVVARMVGTSIEQIDKFYYSKIGSVDEFVQFSRRQDRPR
jgi:site-specific recombinase XerD|tara:strand:+ start:255 stop:1499 length:1245 start_codon:yes stop_codon:yes gene_type:complete